MLCMLAIAGIEGAVEKGGGGAGPTSEDMN
jgi:hypothetical protein